MRISPSFTGTVDPRARLSLLEIRLIYIMCVFLRVCMITTNKQREINESCGCRLRRWRRAQTTSIRRYYNNIATLYLMCAYSNERRILRFSFLLAPKGNKNNDFFFFVKYRLVATWQTISFARSTGQQTPFPPACARESVPIPYVRIILYTGIYNSITYSQ